MLPNLRYEKKFTTWAHTPAEVLAMVRRHPAGFQEVYPPRTVNNVYLDSPGRRDYHDHIHGSANRSKTRVRWYGQDCRLIEKPTLELKLKRGMVSGKVSHALPAIHPGDAGLGALLEAALHSAAPPGILGSVTRHLEPALLNAYHRHYFVSRDGRYRLTVDSDLRFAPPVSFRLPVPWLPAAPTVIVELKYRVEHSVDAHRVTNSLPFRVTNFSKYVAGLDRV